MEPHAPSSGIAVVTGANRGLGLAAVHALAQRGMTVVLAGRDERAVTDEVRLAREKGWSVEPAVLDVASASSIEQFRKSFVGRSVSVVISNAAVMLEGFDDRVLARTLAVNFHGATRVVRALEDSFQTGTNVVMVSSGMGELDGFDARVRGRFDPPVSFHAIELSLANYLSTVRTGKEHLEGWPRTAYAISKVALNAWTRLYATEMRSRGVHVNAVCPGWVRTRMGGSGATRSVDEGVSGIVWAATLPHDGPTGHFFRDAQSIEW